MRPIAVLRGYAVLILGLIEKTAAIRCIVSVVLSLACAFPASSADVNIDTPRLTVGSDGSWEYTSAGTMSGTELGKMIENAIGKGNYQQTTVMLNTCHSGAGTATVGGQLSGSNNVISTCGSGQTTVVVLNKQDGSIRGFMPSFFDAVITDPSKPVDDQFEKGKAGEERLPKTPAEEAAAKARYEAYRQRISEENKKRVSDKKPPLEVPPEWDKGGRDKRVQEPQSGQSADKPGTKPLAAGKKSNHAVIYRTDDRDSAKKEADKAKEAFKKAGFDSITELTPPTASDNAALDKAAGGPAPTLRADMATPDNLKKKLDALKPVMNPEEHLAVVVIAHGALSTASNNTQSSSDAGTGARHSIANPRDHLGTHATASLLGEEALAGMNFIIDDYMLTRWAQPALVIQTLDEQSQSGQPVRVSINNVFVGNMSLAPDGLGHSGYHYLALTDDIIAEIVNTTPIESGLYIDFGFASLGDFFLLATEGDLAAMGGGLGYAGTNLLFNLSGSPVSAPGSLALLMFGSLLLIGAARSGKEKRCR
jgi:hypothetical protein